MKLTPLADRVLMKPVEVEETTKSGVIVAKYAGTDVELDDCSYTIVRQEDILAVVAD